MEHALSISELIEHIAAQCSPHDAGRLALTARRFLEPGLDKLWEFGHIPPIICLLPQDARQRTQCLDLSVLVPYNCSTSSTRMWSAARTIQDEDLQRLRYYTKRIQTFDHPWLMPWEVDPALLDSILQVTSSPLFPKLVSIGQLDISGHPAAQAFLRWVLSPTVKEVRMHFKANHITPIYPQHLTMVEDIPSQTEGNLTIFKMSLGTITNTIEINRFVEAMAICAMRCSNLKTLSLHGLSSTLGDIAHYLPQLKFLYVESGNLPVDVTFPSTLTYLNIALPGYDILQMLPSLPHLQSLTLRDQGLVQQNTQTEVEKLQPGSLSTLNLLSVRAEPTKCLELFKAASVSTLRELDFAFTNGILQNQVVDGIITSVSLDILSTGTPPSLNVLLISGYSSSSRVEGTTVSLISSDLITSLGICVNLDILNLSLPIDLSDSEIETLVKNLRRLHKLILGLENDYVQYGRRKNIIPSATLAALGTVAQYCPNLMDVYIPVDARVPPTLPPTPTGTTSNTKLTELQVTNSLIDKDVEGVAKYLKVVFPNLKQVTKRRYVHGDDERWNQVQELLWTNKESIEKPEWKKKSMSGFARFA